MTLFSSFWQWIEKKSPFFILFFLGLVFLSGFIRLFFNIEWFKREEIFSKKITTPFHHQFEEAYCIATEIPVYIKERILFQIHRNRPSGKGSEEILSFYLEFPDGSQTEDRRFASRKEAMDYQGILGLPRKIPHNQAALYVKTRYDPQDAVLFFHPLDHLELHLFEFNRIYFDVRKIATLIGNASLGLLIASLLVFAFRKEPSREEGESSLLTPQAFFIQHIALLLHRIGWNFPSFQNQKEQDALTSDLPPLSPYPFNPRPVAFLAFLFLINAVFLYVSGGAQSLPLFLRFLIYMPCLTVIPGYAIFSLFSLSKRKDYDPVSVLLASFSHGFSFNFIINLIVFSFHPNIQTTVFISFSLSLFLLTLLHLLFLLKRPEPWSKWIPRIGFKESAWLLAFVAFLSIPYVFLPPGYFSDELVILRKLAENHAIEVSNIGFMPYEATTYIFVPFYLLQTIVSVCLGVDVLVAVSIMWAFTSALGLLCLMQLSFLATRSRLPGILLFSLAFLYALLVPGNRSDFLVGFLPSADRYGFSVGCLLPLAIFHFLIHIEDKEVNPGMFIALVYLIVEIAFVHAIEALMMLGVVLIFSVLLFLQKERSWKLIHRCGHIILLCGLILLGYKICNLVYAPDLAAFVASMRVDAQEALATSFSEKGLLSTFYPGPKQGESYLEAIQRINRSLGYQFVFFVLLFLPYYVLMTRSRYGILYASTISASSLLLMSGGLRAFLISIIGTVHLFNSFASFIALLSMVIFVELIYSFIQGIIQIKLRKAIPILGASLLFFFLVQIDFYQGEWVTRLFIFHEERAAFFFAITLILAALRLRQGARSFLLYTNANEKESLSYPWRVQCKTVILLFLFLVSYFSIIQVKSLAYSCQEPAYFLFNYPWRPEALEKDNVEVMKQLSNSGILNMDTLGRRGVYALPISEKFIRFVREEMPPLRTWLSTNSLTIPICSNQFTPIAVYEGKMVGEWIYNEKFKEQLWKEDLFSITSLLSDQTRYEAIIDYYQINYLHSEPYEYHSTKNLWLETEWLQRRLKIIYDDGKHLIFECL